MKKGFRVSLKRPDRQMEGTVTTDPYLPPHQQVSLHVKVRWDEQRVDEEPMEEPVAILTVVSETHEHDWAYSHNRQLPGAQKKCMRCDIVEPDVAAVLRRKCVHCHKDIVVERPDDPYFHEGTGDERCEGTDEFATPPEEPSRMQAHLNERGWVYRLSELGPEYRTKMLAFDLLEEERKLQRQLAGVRRSINERFAKGVELIENQWTQEEIDRAKRYWQDDLKEGQTMLDTAKPHQIHDLGQCPCPKRPCSCGVVHCTSSRCNMPIYRNGIAPLRNPDLE
jgi:hypothetical protein